MVKTARATHSFNCSCWYHSLPGVSVATHGLSFLGGGVQDQSELQAQLQMRPTVDGGIFLPE